jgi:YVTN family beta-propeller protein
MDRRIVFMTPPSVEKLADDAMTIGVGNTGWQRRWGRQGLPNQSAQWHDSPMNSFQRVTLAILLSLCGVASASDPQYHVASRIDGPDGSFDYVTFDPKAQRLFIARDYGVMAVDVASNHVIPKLVPGHDDSAVLLIPGTNEMMSTNWGSQTATVFDRTTGTVRAVVGTGKGPDAAVYDATHRHAYVMNTESKDISVIDVAQAKLVATIPLGTKPEAAVLDGKGRLYVNLEATAQVAIIDTATNRVIGHHALPGCVEPTAIAFDAVSNLLIAACHNGVAKLIAADSGKDHGAVPIGRDADGAIFDTRRRLTYVSAADGTVTIFRLSESGETKVMAHLQTAVGARTVALDEESGRLYLASPVIRKGAHAGKGFQVLVVAP